MKAAHSSQIQTSNRIIQSKGLQITIILILTTNVLLIIIIEYSLSDIHRDMVWLLVEITSGNTKQASSRLYDLKHED